MSLYKQFKTNSQKEVDGIRIKFDEVVNEDGTTPVFIISRMGKGNKPYQKNLEARVRPYRRQIELNTLANETSEKVFLNVFVDTILKGWENVQDENNVEIPYTRENAIRVMSDLSDVYERLQEESKIASNFRDLNLEADGKN